MKKEAFTVVMPDCGQDRWRMAKLSADRKARKLIDKHGWQAAKVTLLHPETLQVRTMPGGERLVCYEFEIVEAV